ncbi:MAG: hypothetical protein M3O22_01645 [Pseudomonadota bacterium]|nr:hypothetical protein [Pseudomonadota bacterium]
MQAGVQVVSPLIEKHKAALFQAAIDAHGRADPRYSHFPVGAAVLTADGRIFTGANWETTMLEALCKGQHAEQGAMASMIGSAGPQEVVAVAVAGGDLAMDMACTPCGNCREFLSVHAGPDTPVFMVAGGSRVLGVHRLGDLLPARSGPYSQVDHGPRRLMIPAERSVFETLRLIQSRAYVPYSKAPVAMAVRTETGEIFYGVTREDAAWAGCSATQNALGAMVAELGSEAKIVTAFYGPYPGLADGIVMPTGPDRQILREHCITPARLTVLACAGKEVVEHTLAVLLPHDFGPDNLAAAKKR